MGLLKLAKELEVLAYELDVFGVQKDAAGFATNNRGRKLYDTKGFKAGEKDLWRMRDMKVRAKGDDKKLVSLANQMANSIRDPEKAFRRADAASQIFMESKVKDEIVGSFLDAARSLQSMANTKTAFEKEASTPKLYEYEFDGMRFYTDKRMPQGIRLPAGKAKFTKSYFTVSGALGKEISENKEAGKKELTPPEKHQLKILTDTVKNPSKGLLSGPNSDEAKRILKEKFHYTDKQISDLEKM